MKKPPPGWPRISAGVYYLDPVAAIDWLVRAFGFEVRVRIEGDAGQIVHSEVTYGEGLVMVGGAGDAALRPDSDQQSPKALGGANTQKLCIYVDDVDAHYARAVAAGAQVKRELATTDYGAEYWVDRSYEAADPEGHRWYFVQRMS